ncbi:phage holin family protein [Umezawaea sp. Da 62-37]|uniref:phage holin family protein n=1 Tax=Umezawaea sp. Da 62-37 TaxID=3075927 RepID=UPI0028F6D8B5|nr:phage holin family protein [Umezawaea sp. Da 62-37]WNV91705.1 phage holin family protein [Umezawaea sp. Da 62-37]
MTSARENTNGSRATDGLPPVPSIPLRAENAARIAEETSLGGLVRDATSHLSTLVRAEVELAKSEVVKEVKKGITGSVYFIVALTVLLFSLFFLFLTIGYALYDIFGWPLSLSFLTVFVAMLLVTALFGFLGYRKVRKLKKPERTIESARDIVDTLRHRGEAH